MGAYGETASSLIPSGCPNQSSSLGSPTQNPIVGRLWGVPYVNMADYLALVIVTLRSLLEGGGQFQPSNGWFFWQPAVILRPVQMSTYCGGWTC